MCNTKMTLVNGNGQDYTLDLPKLIILGQYNEVAMNHIFENTGLNFQSDGYIMTAQPTSADQIVKLFMTYNFKTRFYNNGSVKNTIYLKSDHHIGFDVESICYDCVAHNHLSTNGLSEGDYLAC